MREAGAPELARLVTAAGQSLGQPARLYLVAGTSHLAEGWRPRAPSLEFAGEQSAPPALEQAVRAAGAAAGIRIVWESPADVIPLPDGSEERSRPMPQGITGGILEVRHFDPYSVVLRLIARGDEPDYVTSVEYVRRGWVDLVELDRLVAQVLPRFTNQTLAQDPAEFRRKLRGLRQLCGGGPPELRYEPAVAESAWP